MRNFEAHTDEIRKQMLDEIGVKSVEDFFDNIPKACLLNGLDLPDPLSELAAQKELSRISKENKTS